MAVIDWDEVEEAVEDAKAITWDTCHKIYVLMDNEQVAKMREYGYGDEPDSLFTCDELTPSQMLATLKEWFEKSCWLRFIQAVETHEDENKGFTSLIEQGATDTEPCEDCGYEECAGACNDEDEEDEDEEDEEDEE